MLEGIEGRKRRGRQRMRWFDSITDSMNTNLSELREILEDRGAWHAAVHGVTKSWTGLKNKTSKNLLPADLYSQDVLPVENKSLQEKWKVPKPVNKREHNHIPKSGAVSISSKQYTASGVVYVMSCTLRGQMGELNGNVMSQDPCILKCFVMH